MSALKEQITRQQVAERLRSSIPKGVDANQVIDGVLLSLTPPDQRTRPIERDLGAALGNRKVLLAWYEADASIIKTALEVLSELGLSFISEAMHWGVALKPLVCFLVELHRHRVRVSDPTEVATLLVLHKAGSGLTAGEIRKRIAEADGAKAPSLSDVEGALDRLAKAETSTKPPETKPLVRLDGQIWKSLV
jgi:hypothetical protein